MRLVGMKLEQLSWSGFSVHKDLVVQSAPGEEGAVFGRVLSHKMVPYESVFPLHVPRAGWVTL